MDRHKKWRATYRIICPLPKDDAPLKLDAVEEERCVSSPPTSSSNRKESILTTIDQSNERDDEVGDDDDIVTEAITEPTVTNSAAPSRAGSWLKPRVDYHPSTKFNTIDSSATKVTQLTRSQTRTYSWIERADDAKEPGAGDDSLSEMTNSTVYTDKNPRIVPMRFTQETQPISPSFQRRFGTNTSVTTHATASSSHHIRISKTKLIILSIVVILVLILAIVLLAIFLR